MPFKPIETQEEFDSMIADRLARAQKKHDEQIAELKKGYEGYLSPEDAAKLKASFEDKGKETDTSINELNERAKTLQEQLDQANAKVSKFEADALKTRVALMNGIPYELANKLEGATEEELTADAKKLAGFFASKPAPKSPEYTPSNGEADGVTAAFQKLNPNLKF